MVAGVDSQKGFFYTDWAAMTVNDWVGLLMNVIIFLLMFAAYWYVFHPRNKEKLEKQRYLPDEDDDREDSEERK